MKSVYVIFISLALLLTIGLAKDCSVEDGCIIQESVDVFFPVIDQYGHRNEREEAMKPRYVTIFDDKLVIYGNAEIKDSTTAEEDQNLINLRVSYSEVLLDCGVDGNKLCSLGEYRGNFDLPDKYSSKLSNVGNSNSNCIVLPVVMSIVDSSEAITYVFLCKDNARAIFDLKHKMSRKISLFHTKILLDGRNAYNGITRQSGKFYSVINTVLTFKEFFVTLNFRKLTAYGQKDELNSVGWEEKLEGIRGNVLTIEDAIEAGNLKQDWKVAISGAKPDNNCCFYVPIANKDYEYRLMCYASFDAKIQDAEICSGIVKLWVSHINNFNKRRNAVDHLEHLLRIDQPFELTDYPQKTQDMKTTLTNLYAYISAECTKLTNLVTEFSRSECPGFITDQLQQEIRALSLMKPHLKDALEHYVLETFDLSGEGEGKTGAKTFAFRFKTLNLLKKRKA